jgi:hypothetical protein
MKRMRQLLFVVLFSGLSATLGGCASIGTIVSDSPNPGMTKISYEIEINAPKTAAWNVLADYANLDWTETVKDAQLLNEKTEGVGMVRNCDLASGGFIIERVTDWKEGSEMTYVIDDASDPVTPGSYAIWSVSGDQNRSKISFEVHYKLKYGILGNAMNVMMAKRKFSKQIIGFMGELKMHLEK